MAVEVFQYPQGEINMTIYLHPNSDNSLGEAYATAFLNCDEIFVLSAYLRDWKKFKISSQCTNATLIVGMDFGITRKSALSAALNWKDEIGGKCHFYVAENITGFHPKIVMWRRGSDRYLIIGSSNLTVAAFESNYEANLQIKISSKQYCEIESWIADVLANSVPVTTKWISTYQEAPVKAGEQRPRSTPPIGTPGGFVLPRFPSLAKAIAERRERQFAFTEVRQDFEEQVRNCALEKITEDDFYNWLVKNWNGSNWKLQGNGVFRHPKSATNWQILCAGLLRCIDSAEAERDMIVCDVYNYLESTKLVEVRKAFLTEMLCHFFPNEYPLWNAPVEIWLKKIDATSDRPRGMSVGEKYIWLANQLRLAIRSNPGYPVHDLAELDHVIWAYCKHKGWLDN